jgi:hypothetical protein
MSPDATKVGDETCVPWGKGDLGLKCTGTYTSDTNPPSPNGNTAWDPWTQKNLPASDPPTVTISQAKDLSDQDVQVTWSNFTPTLDANTLNPNPSGVTTPDGMFPVSIFECKGTDPDYSSLTALDSDCYLANVSGGTGASGPANGQVDATLDGDAPPDSTQSPSGAYSPFWDYDGGEFGPAPTLPDGSTFTGGNPSTWTGQADFHVEAPTPRTKGGYFNCSSRSPCSLVIDPNWGGTPASQGNLTDTSQCQTHYLGGYDGENGDWTNAAGEVPGQAQSSSVSAGSASAVVDLTGESAACWAADRIVIPLSFGATPANCPTGTTPQFYAEGSPMMDLQMNQWTTGWCTGSGALSVQYVSNSESVARDDFLAGGQVGGSSTDMALVTMPVDASAQEASSRKFTYAPLANSGTGVAFEVDDNGTGSQINRMVLNPDLLAKLTTQSYSLRYGICTASPPTASLTCDPAVQKNPVTLWDDPEFLSLNQDCEPYGEPADYTCGEHAAQPAQGLSAYSDFPADAGGNNVNLGAFLPTVLQPDSDMTDDLTGLIEADPDAKSFLGGQIDAWGMHVNKNYWNVPYPEQAFSVLDSGATNPAGVVCPKNPSTGQPECGSVAEQDATMNVSWNFQTDLNTIDQDLLTNQPTADQNAIACPASIGGGTGCTNVQELTFPAVPPQAEGDRALLSVVGLGDIGNYDFPAASIVNASGTAVAPTQASVEAALKDMETNPDGITQYYNYSSTDKSAYPLTMVDYAMVPTCGLSKSEASDIAEFLTRAATTGQAQGEAPGQLGPGYYPLTAAQKAQTLNAAAEVKSQDCKTTPVDHTVDGQTGVNDTSKAGSAGGGQATTGPGSASGKSAKSATSPKAGAKGAGAEKAQTAAFGQKSPDSGLAGLLLLLAIIAGALVLVGGPAAWALTATGKWPVLVGWVRPAAARIRPVVKPLRAIRIWRP